MVRPCVHVGHRLLRVAWIEDNRSADFPEIGVYHHTQAWDLTIHEDSATVRRVATHYGVFDEGDLLDRILSTFQALGCAVVTPEGSRIGPDQDLDDRFVLEDLHVPAGSRFRDALQFAALLHAEHTRKGTSIPYVSHLMAVASLVMENGGSEDAAIAALLHDALEDRPEAVTVSSLQSLFGSDVRRIVVACSDGLTTDGRSRDEVSWRERKQRYIAHLEEADPDAPLVALADKVHNARAILRDLRATNDADAFWGRFNASRADQFWYYGTLAELFARRFPGPLATELAELADAIRVEDTACATRRNADQRE
jgi:hypothetical protein